LLYPKTTIFEILLISSPLGCANYLYTSMSSVSSASPTPLQVLAVSENDRLQNLILPLPLLSSNDLLPGGSPGLWTDLPEACRAREGI
jgi:hypothetical protein